MLQLSAHWPILQVFVPLAAALIVLLFRNPKAAWMISALATLGSLIVSVELFIATYSGDAIRYNVGNWSPPYGIELKIDSLNATLLVLVSFIATMATFFSYHVNKQEIATKNISKFYALFLLCLSGFLGILVTNDAFNLYVFLEISSLSSYSLVAIGRDRTALTAAFEYLINGTVGATFYLFGLGFIYASTGTLNISYLATSLHNLRNNHAVQVGMLFITVGLLIKMALFPLHSWLIRAYSTAPSFIAIFLSGVATKVMIYAFLRMTYSVFGIDYLFNNLQFGHIINVLSLLAIIFAALQAMKKQEIKEVFACSSVAQIGYIMLMVSLNTKAAFTAAIIHIINHGIIKSGIFMVMASIAYRFGNANAFAGLLRTLPNVTVYFSILLASLVGIPATAGFVSKWYIFTAIVESQSWIALGCFAVGSFLSAVYSWKIVESMYRSQPVIDNMENHKLPKSMALCLALMVVITVSCGIYTAAIVDVASNIASLFYT